MTKKELMKALEELKDNETVKIEFAERGTRLQKGDLLIVTGTDVGHSAKGKRKTLYLQAILD